MFRNKITEQEGLQLPTGSAVMSEPPGPEVATTSGTGGIEVAQREYLANDDAAERVEVAAGFGADDAAADGVVEEGGRGKRGKRENWSKEEKQWLWGCYVSVRRFGKRDGYQKKVYDLY